MHYPSGEVLERILPAAFRGSPTSSHLGLDLPGSSTVEEAPLLFQPPHL